MKRLDQRGSHIVAFLVAVLVVGVIGFAGYTVYQRNQTIDTNSTATTASSKGVPSTINNQADLTATSKALDDASAQVNTTVNGDTLDSDINSTL